MTRPRIPLFISPPRTRSTVLHHKMTPYADKVLQSSFINHSELFLYRHGSVIVDDRARGVKERPQMLFVPDRLKNEIRFHVIYPDVFDSIEECIGTRIDLLEEESERGVWYYFKLTPMVDVSFFSRVWKIQEKCDVARFVPIFTDRRNKEDQIRSLVYALGTGSFHIRDRDRIGDDEVIEVTEDEYHRYRKVIEEMDERVEDYKKYLEEAGVKYEVWYYEDLGDEDIIDRQLSIVTHTDKWKRYGMSDLVLDAQRSYGKLMRILK